MENIPDMRALHMAHDLVTSWDAGSPHMPRDSGFGAGRRYGRLRLALLLDLAPRARLWRCHCCGGS